MTGSIHFTVFSRLILLVFVCSVSSLHVGAQTDSSLAFFPLQPNDLWQYRHHYTPCCCNYEISSYFTVRVAGDTVLRDGLDYKVLETNSPQLISTRYLRVDTATANVYEFSGDTSVGDYLVDSLRATVGSSFRSTLPNYGGAIMCERIDTATVAGIRTMVKLFAGGGGIFYRLAYGLGLTQIDTMVFQCTTWDSRSDDLCYARIGGREYGTIVGVSNQPEIIPGSFTIEQNYPNPFNPTTTIKYELPKAAHVILTVFDILGREVSVLVNDRRSAGVYEIKFDGSNLASGVYFYRLQAEDFIQSKRLLILK